MMFNVPLPGGTTGHAVGGALIALLLGDVYKRQVESVDEEDEALFGNHSNLYNSGNTYSPDWPRNSQRVAALWKSQYGHCLLYTSLPLRVRR